MNDIYASRRIRTPEEHLSAVLLRMVLDHCARPEGTLDSFGRVANAEAMRLLAADGFIRIDGGWRPPSGTRDARSRNFSGVDGEGGQLNH
jgi:hypothetical protein